MLAGRKQNEFDALAIGFLMAFIFFGIMWIIFSVGLKDTGNRIFILICGSWPNGLIQFFTFLAFFWAMIILGSKSRKLDWEHKAFDLSILPEEEHKVMLPNEINDLRLRLSKESNLGDSILIKILSMACTKFRANKSVQETMDVVRIQSDISMNYLETSFSIIRYLAWSIPSIGFIGTVFGISGALGQMDAAAAGDLSGVTSLLGTAFDTTLVALFLSIILMFRIHRVQQNEESFIIEVQDYLMKNFVNRIYVPKKERI